MIATYTCSTVRSHRIVHDLLPLTPHLARCTLLPKSRIATPSQIIDYMDECSISKAVVFGFPWENPQMFIENNEAVLEFSSKHPDRIIPFAAFALNDPEKACAEAQRTLENDFMGLGELSMYETGWDKTALNTLRECVRFASSLKKPVMIHVNEPVGHYYPGKINTDFDALLKMIGQFPEVDFILAHFGGGIFFYALMPEIKALLESYIPGYCRLSLHL